jgi:hypothetical protein
MYVCVGGKLFLKQLSKYVLYKDSFSYVETPLILDLYREMDFNGMR